MEKQLYTISVFTENNVGVLNQVYLRAVASTLKVCRQVQLQSRAFIN